MRVPLDPLPLFTMSLCALCLIASVVFFVQGDVVAGVVDAAIGALLAWVSFRPIPAG